MTIRKMLIIAIKNADRNTTIGHDDSLIFHSELVPQFALNKLLVVLQYRFCQLKQVFTYRIV
jgi:hypothetical protein